MRPDVTSLALNLARTQLLEVSMTFAKGAGLVAGFVGAMALGAWIGPYVTDDKPMEMLTTAADRIEGSGLPPESDAAPARRQRAAATRATPRAAAPAVALSATALHSELRPLLNEGTDMTRAADGFRDAEQLAAVAHAARNTGVPFVLLKHRVLVEGKTLGAAISESKPQMNAEIEATRALAEARSDLARLAG
jgi:hypothetical protein